MEPLTGDLLEARLGKLLSQSGLTLAVAESCTGGLIGHRITNVSGSSAYFLGGVLAYANEAKVQLLGVAEETLIQHGAVSRETVLEMARGARAALGVDIGLSVSGIAGPTGGTPEKPVGLVWIGLSAPGAERAVRFLFQGDRLEVKEQAAQAALQLVVDEMEKAETMEPVEVTARFDVQGKVNPLSFTWEDILYQVDATGRRWEDERGQHILVMVPGGRVFELFFETGAGRWFLKQTGPKRAFM